MPALEGDAAGYIKDIKSFFGVKILKSEELKRPEHLSDTLEKPEHQNYPEAMFFVSMQKGYMDSSVKRSLTKHT